MKIVFSTKVATKLNSSELDEIREKELSESVESSVGILSVVSRNFAGQEVKFVCFPDEVDNNPGIEISVSSSAEKLSKEVLEELIGHTIAFSAGKEKNQVALRQSYDTPAGRFHTFAELSREGGTPVIYVGLASEIDQVQESFKKKSSAAGRDIRIHSSPRTRSEERKRKEKKKKKVSK